MQRNEVIDLRNYRGEGDETTGNDSEAAVDELPPGTTILHGQYKITDFLNSGGFGITYRAQDSLEREVVIKECFPSVMVFRAGRDVRVRSKVHAEEFSSMVQSFVKEAHALAAMDHKNIVKVHQVFEENETAYMAIDYIDGLDLLAVIEEQPERLGPREIERIARKMLRAIKYVHDRGMLHRDISPDNILLDADDEPILIDFGAAREKAKKTGRVMSRMKFVKDGYSPQEFYVEGTEQGPWSDLYSFAASLYHLIDGAPPEEGQKRMAALAQKQPDPYVPLHGRIKGFSRGFLKTIDRSLQVAPVNRFQSADEWLAALKPGSDRRSQRVTSRERSKPAPISTPKPRNAPVTTVPTPAAGMNPASVQTSDAAQTPAPSATDRNQNPTLAERSVRNSMKSELTSEKSTNPFIYVGIAAAAIASVVGMVTLFVLGGGTASETEQVIEPTAMPAPVASRPAEEDNTVPSLPADAPTETAVLPTAPETPAAPSRGETAPLDDASETVATRVLPDFVPLDPALDAGDPRRDWIAQIPRVAVSNPPAASTPQPRPTEIVSATTGDAQVPDPTPLAEENLETPVRPDRDQAELISDTPPSVFLLSEGADLTPSRPDAPVDLVTTSGHTGQQRQLAITALPELLLPNAPILDVAAPAPLPEPIEEGPLAARQVQASHWDVEMPFTAALERVRNANTAKITDVSPNANLTVSGAWIEEGVTIYTFNGETLMPETPLSVHVLMSMNIDPDGYARSTVRYQPEGGNIDRGLLAVPVVRKIILADGTEFEARVVENDWIVSVVSFGETAESTLRVGDLLKQETSTGIEIAGHEDVNRALDLLASRGIETAEFNVLRGGALVKATHELARENGSGERGG